MAKVVFQSDASSSEYLYQVNKVVSAAKEGARLKAKLVNRNTADEMVVLWARTGWKEKIRDSLLFLFRHEETRLAAARMIVHDLGAKLRIVPGIEGNGRFLCAQADLPGLRMPTRAFEDVAETPLQPDAGSVIFRAPRQGGASLAKSYARDLAQAKKTFDEQFQRIRLPNVAKPLNFVQQSRENEKTMSVALVAAGFPDDRVAALSEAMRSFVEQSAQATLRQVLGEPKAVDTASGALPPADYGHVKEFARLWLWHANRHGRHARDGEDDAPSLKQMRWYPALDAFIRKNFQLSFLPMSPDPKARLPALESDVLVGQAPIPDMETLLATLPVRVRDSAYDSGNALETLANVMLQHWSTDVPGFAHRTLARDYLRGILEVAMGKPSEFDALEHMENATRGLKLRLMLATMKNLYRTTDTLGVTRDHTEQTGWRRPAKQHPEKWWEKRDRQCLEYVRAPEELTRLKEFDAMLNDAIRDAHLNYAKTIFPYLDEETQLIHYPFITLHGETFIKSRYLGLVPASNESMPEEIWCYSRLTSPKTALPLKISKLPRDQLVMHFAPPVHGAGKYNNPVIGEKTQARLHNVRHEENRRKVQASKTEAMAFQREMAAKGKPVDVTESRWKNQSMRDKMGPRKYALRGNDGASMLLEHMDTWLANLPADFQADYRVADTVQDLLLGNRQALDDAAQGVPARRRLPSAAPASGAASPFAAPAHGMSVVNVGAKYRHRQNVNVGAHLFRRPAPARHDPVAAAGPGDAYARRLAENDADASPSLFSLMMSSPSLSLATSSFAPAPAAPGQARLLERRQRVVDERDRLENSRAKHTGPAQRPAEPAPAQDSENETSSEDSDPLLEKSSSSLFPWPELRNPFLEPASGKNTGANTGASPGAFAAPMVTPTPARAGNARVFDTPSATGTPAVFDNEDVSEEKILIRSGERDFPAPPIDA
jgi:hypothetical protein